MPQRIPLSDNYSGMETLVAQFKDSLGEMADFNSVKNGVKVKLSGDAPWESSTLKIGAQSALPV